jgi:hypothetical protein
MPNQVPRGVEALVIRLMENAWAFVETAGRSGVPGARLDEMEEI